MPERTIRLVRDGFPQRMPLDTAVSHVLLADASRGAQPETLRLSIPGRSVAFGKHDAVSPGFAHAIAAARDTGFEPFLRLAGGRAAAFHEQTIAVSWTIPDPHPIDGIRDRFAAVAGLLVAACRSLGIPAAVGAVPGEYCPGEFSVRVGATKVAGIGQRLTRSAAHLGAVVVVGGSDSVREALVPVYAALGLDWDPSTAGALSEAIVDLEPADVIDAITIELEREARIEPASLSAETIRNAVARAGTFAAG